MKSGTRMALSFSARGHGIKVKRSNGEGIQALLSLYSHRRTTRTAFDSPTAGVWLQGGLSEPGCPFEEKLADAGSLC
jgi:hypothetical protein